MRSSMQRAFVAFGGNVGSPEATLRAALPLLAGRIGTVERVSSLYETEALTLDGVAQPNYSNAVLSLQTELEPERVLRELLGIELELGRDRSGSARWQPRTIDLDLILHGARVVSTAFLTLPHPEWTRRDFVLIPFHEIAPDVLDPCSGKPVSALLSELLTSPAPRCVIQRLEPR